MSTDPQALYSAASCLVCFGELTQADALELELLVQIANARGIMATDPQSLITAGKCYACFTSSIAQIMKLSLLAQISLAHNPANQTDPASLLSQAKCFSCNSEASQPKLMELALLAQIAT